MSTFTETAHPRGAGGRFVPASHTEPATTLAAGCEASVHARRLDAARHVLDEFPDLEISDHSPVRRGTVTLAELGNPSLALGNCWAVTSEIIEEVGAAEFGTDWLDEITIRRARLGGVHVAILAADRDGMFVIDYTARQFSPDLPFPYIAGVQKWQDRVGHATGTRWVLDD